MAPPHRAARASLRRAAGASAGGPVLDPRRGGFRTKRHDETLTTSDTTVSSPADPEQRSIVASRVPAGDARHPAESRASRRFAVTRLNAPFFPALPALRTAARPPWRSHRGCPSRHSANAGRVPNDATESRAMMTSSAQRMAWLALSVGVDAVELPRLSENGVGLVAAGLARDCRSVQ